MSLELHNFTFGDFLLDQREKSLFLAGEQVPLTPKAFELLLILVENHGRLLEKDELMNSVWAGSFVEEGNLAYTIRLLRKALGDDSQNPLFIETVPRRGYRFIAPVKLVSDSAENFNEVNRSPVVGAVTERKRSSVKLAAVISLIIFIAFLTGGLWLISKNLTGNYAVRSESLENEKLSQTGKVYHAVISPDGKNVIYTNGLHNDPVSVWLRQLDSGNNVEIIPATDNIYSGLAFSPDGNFIYFSRRERTSELQADLYRMSIFGGIPQKFVSETQGWIGVSPDGKKISFVRCFYQPEENCSLWIADSADGKNEKKVAARPKPFRIADNGFSPDGRKLAFAAGQSENQANEFALYEIDLETGAERELSNEKFFNIKSLAWLPDGDGILFTASRTPSKNFRIWKIKNGARAEAITKDSESYSALSLSTDGKMLVSTQVRQDFNIRLFSMDQPNDSKIAAQGTNAAFAPDGSLLISSQMSGNDEIWAVDYDRGVRRQLTNDPADDIRPVLSSDGVKIYFTSNRSGSAQVWKMNSDGSNQVQITKTNGGFPISVSANGEYVFYHHGIDRTLWRVSTIDGTEQRIIDKAKYRFAISPDSLRAAYPDKRGDEKFIVVVSIPDGREQKRFKYPDATHKMPELTWSGDGKSLIYVLTDANFKKFTLWKQNLDGSPPKLTADLGTEELSESLGLAVSPDLKYFTIAQGGWRHDAVLIRRTP